MRVVSLIPSSTEIVDALGLSASLVGRSHECDFPALVRALPVLTEPKLRTEGVSSAEIDAQVRALVREALAVYRVDAEALAAVRPDVIITQTQCEVCAVSLKEVEEAVCQLVSSRPRIVALAPNSLADVFADLRRVADALGVADKGARVEADLRARMQAIAARVPRRTLPSVACIEWIDPLMVAGNWMPTLVELAGGRDVLGVADQHSPFIRWEALRAADPEVIVVLPCGFDIARTQAELPTLERLPGWSAMRAVRGGRVYLADGNQYFNRPGPRIVESLEILVEILHGERLGHLGHGFVPGILSGAASVRLPRQAEDNAMAHDAIRVTAVLPATPGEIYEAWLDGGRHGQFTGGSATVEARVGGRHTAWDGYIEGTILELEPSAKIVQSWRSLDFPQEAGDSRLEILFASAPGGTEVTLVHTEIPEGQGIDYEEGWKEHYFKPMQRFFTSDAGRSTGAAPAPKPAKAAVKAKAKAAPKKKAKLKASPKKKAKLKAAPKKKAKLKAAPKKKAKLKAAPKKKAKLKAAPKKKAKGKKR